MPAVIVGIGLVVFGLVASPEVAVAGAVAACFGVGWVIRDSEWRG